MPNTEKTNKLSRAADTELQERLKSAAELFDKYGSIIRAMIRSHLNDPSKVDDIFQDLFLSLVYKPIPPDIKDVRGYLYIAIKNDVLDAVRQSKVYQDRIHKYAQCRRYSATQQDPQSTVIQSEETQVVFQMVEGKLSHHEAEAIILRYKHDQDIGDAAREMRVNRRTFSRYVCTGLKKVRQFCA